MIELPKLKDEEFKEMMAEAKRQQSKAKKKNYKETFKPKDDETSLNQTFNSLAAELSLAGFK